MKIIHSFDWLPQYRAARFEMVNNLNGIVIRIDLPTSSFQQVTNNILGNGRQKIYTITSKVLAILRQNNATISGYYYLSKSDYDMLTELAEMVQTKLIN